MSLADPRKDIEHQHYLMNIACYEKRWKDAYNHAKNVDRMVGELATSLRNIGLYINHERDMLLILGSANVVMLLLSQIDETLVEVSG